ncbi:hypothetical protein [Kibdelosporangium philippinense]
MRRGGGIRTHDLFVPKQSLAWFDLASLLVRGMLVSVDVRQRAR